MLFSVSKDQIELMIDELSKVTFVTLKISVTDSQINEFVAVSIIFSVSKIIERERNLVCWHCFLRNIIKLPYFASLIDEKLIYSDDTTANRILNRA